MKPVPEGDTALVLVPAADERQWLGHVSGVAAAIEAAGIPGLTDVVAAPERVAVGYNPLLVGDMAAFEKGVADAAGSAEAGIVAGGATHVIPVVYDGPDMQDVCAAHGINRDRLVAIHTEPDYRVEAVGFLPGFGYLGGLAESLATPRRATPRPSIPAGSVGIGGSQTGVYPFASPGGWNLIGRSSVRLFDPGRPRPGLWAVGDRVRFTAADPAGMAADEKAPAVPETAKSGHGRPVITVVQPGLFTTIQDLGRPGYRASGVPLSGAADPVSLRLANLLVGNPEDSAAIECTLVGPTLRFERDAVVACVGGEFPGLPSGKPVSVAAGTEIALGHVTSGCRGCLAVAGGIVVPPVLGSRSTLVSAGLGGLAGRPLRAGDRLGGGSPAFGPKARFSLPPLLDSAHRPLLVRVLPGEHADWFDEAAWAQTFRVSSRSNRMGVRLEGASLTGSRAAGEADAAARAASLRSIPVFPGTIQVPPDGFPIILLADAQTIGGYPIFGHVITADLPVVAQLRPGDELAWRPVSLGEAHAALWEIEAAVSAFGEAEQP